jgi:WD40 repeat protein
MRPAITEHTMKKTRTSTPARVHARWLWLVALGSSVAIAFEVSKATEIIELSGHRSQIFALAFNPNNMQLLSGADEPTARLWDLSAGRTAFELQGHTGEVTGFAFSEDGKTIYTVGGGNTLRGWNVSDGKNTLTVNNLTCGGSHGSLALLSAKQAVIGCNGIKVVDLETKQVVKTFARSIAQNSRFSLSKDRKTLIATTGGEDVAYWDTVNGSQLRVLKGHTEQVSKAVAFSPAGNASASGGADKTARLWSYPAGKELFVLKHDATVTAVAFSADGKLLATGSSDNIVKLWEVSTGKLVGSLEGHKEDVTALAFNPNGKVLASGDDDGVIKLWGAQ